MDKDRTAFTSANPSGAPVAGGATTPASDFGGHSWKARGLRFIARVGRRMTGFAYRALRELDEHQERKGPAGRPMRAAGAPPPGELHGESWTPSG